MPWSGFEDTRVTVRETDHFLTHGGGGPPVLLLHGFPQTHACWSLVAAMLARSHRVLAPDLRGYGASHAPAGGPRGGGYTKREMAGELVELMAGLGHRRFAVVGHDRGARVAYRMALDHRDRVTRVAVLNVVPTLEQFERMGGGPSLGYWPWFLLAQPAPFPERLIGADPGALLDHAFDTWTGDPAAIDTDHRAAYRAAMTPETIASMCAAPASTPTVGTTPAIVVPGASPRPSCLSPARTRPSWLTRRRSGSGGPTTSSPSVYRRPLHPGRGPGSPRKRPHGLPRREREPVAGRVRGPQAGYRPAPELAERVRARRHPPPSVPIGRCLP